MESQRFKKTAQQKLKGLTDLTRLTSLSDKQIEQAALSDPDAPLLTDYQLKQFKTRMRSKFKQN